MTALSIQPPYPIFTEADGSPLENGFVYIGTANLDPVANPIAVYWDAALTVPAAQPIRTLNGYPSRNGTPARLYVGSDYSIRVNDAKGVTVYSAPAATERWSNVVVTGVDASEVNFLQAGAGALARTAQSKLRDVVSVLDFGADLTGATDSTVAFNNALATGKTVFAPEGDYRANITASTSTFDLRGAGMDRAIIRPFNTSLPALKIMADPGDANFWRRSYVRDISFRGTGNVGPGVTFGDPASYVVGNERIGRVDMERVEITGFDRGVFKTCGNIGNRFVACRVQNNNYSYYAQSSDYASLSAPIMHSGYDIFDGGAWGYAGLANIFIKDRILGKGGWLFRGVDMEGSTGYNVVAFADSSFDYLPSLVLDGCWFEANASGGSITIDTLTGTLAGLPRDFYISGIKNVTIKNGYIGKVTLLNGCNVVAEKCGTDTITAGIFDLSIDASSTFSMDGWAYTTGMRRALTFAPFAASTDNPSIDYTGVTNSVPGALVGTVRDATVLLGFTGTAPIVGGGGGYTGTVVNDGLSFETCSEYVVTGSASRIVPDVTTVVGKYYAVTYQARLASGSNGFVYVANLASGQLIDHSGWRHYAFVKRATTTSSGFSMNSAGASSTLRIGAMQIVQFDTAQDAYEYLYRGRIASNSDARSAGLPFSAFTDVGGGGASFNSANVAVTLASSGYRKILEASLRGDLTRIKVDFIVALNDIFTGASLDQQSGITTVSFASTASTPTQVFGAATVTFRWVQQGTTPIWQLEGQITSGGPTALALAGLAFVKGK